MFVSIEGVDGSGKTTLFNRLRAYKEEFGGNEVIFIDKKAPIFDNKYISNHMAIIGDVLWRYDDDAPMWLLGDEHWFFLLASWFSAIDKCIVQPNIALDKTVIVNNWITKYVARFSLKSDFDIIAFNKAISGLTLPDKVIYLDLDPEIAASRKLKYDSSESGLMDGGNNASKESFIKYQKKVSEIYLNTALKNRCHIINVANKNAPSVLECAKELIFPITTDV